MPSARSTQPRLVTEPTTKPTLAAPRHSRMPTCTRWIGCCALAPVKDAASIVAATPARMNERRMKKSPVDECGASRESGARRSPGACSCYATTAAAVPDLPGANPPHKKRPAPRASFALALWLLSRDDGGDAGECASENRH